MDEKYVLDLYDYLNTDVNFKSDFATWSEDLRTDDVSLKLLHTYIINPEFGERAEYPQWSRDIRNVLNGKNARRGKGEVKVPTNGIPLHDFGAPAPKEVEPQGNTTDSGFPWGQPPTGLVSLTGGTPPVESAYEQQVREDKEFSQKLEYPTQFTQQKELQNTLESNPNLSVEEMTRIWKEIERLDGVMEGAGKNPVGELKDGILVSEGVLNNGSGSIEFAREHTKSVKKLEEVNKGVNNMLTSPGESNKHITSLSPVLFLIPAFFSNPKGGGNVKVGENVKEEIANQLLKNPKLLAQALYQGGSDIPVRVKEQIITAAKIKVFTKAISKVDYKIGVIQEELRGAKRGDLVKRNELLGKIEELKKQRHELFGIYEIDKVTGEMATAFKKTAEDKNYEEQFSNDPLTDFGSTLLNGIVTAAYDLVTFPVTLLAGAGDVFTDKDKYSVFDKLGVLTTTIGNELNVFPVSSKGQIYQDGKLNITPRTVSKVISQQVGNILALTTGMGGGPVYANIGKRLLGKGGKDVVVQAAARQYALTLNQNLEDARNLGLDGSDAFLYQQGVSISTAIISMINPEFRYASPFNIKLRKGLATSLKNAINQEAVKKAFQGYIKDVLKEVGEEFSQEGAKVLIATALLEEKYQNDFFEKENIVTLLASTLINAGTFQGVALPTKISSSKKKYYNDIHKNSTRLIEKIDEMIYRVKLTDSSDPKNIKLLEDLEKSKLSINLITEAINTSPKEVPASVITLLVEKKKLVGEMEKLSSDYHATYERKIEVLSKKIGDAMTDPVAEKKRLIEEREQNPDETPVYKYEEKIKSLDKEIAKREEEKKGEEVEKKTAPSKVDKGVTDNSSKVDIPEEEEKTVKENGKINVLETGDKGVAPKLDTDTGEVTVPKETNPTDTTTTNIEQKKPKQENIQVEEDSEVAEEEVYNKEEQQKLDEFRREVTEERDTTVAEKVVVHDLKDPEVKTLADQVILALKKAKVKTPKALYSNPLGGTAYAVWNAAIDTAILAIEAGSSADVAIRKAVKRVKKSDWYKKIISKSTKKIAIDETVKELKVLTNAYVNAKVAPSYTGTKGKIRKFTGLTDTSKKVKTSEAVALKKTFKDYIKGGKWASQEGKKRKNDFIDAVNKELKKLVKGTPMTKEESIRILNRVKGINLGSTERKSVEQIENLIKQVFGIIGKIKTRHFKKTVEVKRKTLKRLLKTKFASEDNVDILNSIVNYPTSLMSEKELIQLDEVLNWFTDKESEKEVDWDKVYDLDSNLHESFLTRVEEEKETEDEPKTPHIEGDNSEVISKIKKLRSEVSTKLRGGLIEIRALNKELLEKFLVIKPEYFETVPVKKLKVIASALEDLKKHNLLQRGVYSEHVNREERKLIVANINAELGDNILKVRKSWKQDFEGVIKSLVGKKQKAPSYAETLTRLDDIMLPYVDEIVQNFKRNPLYVTIINPVTSKLELSNEETLITSNKLTSLMVKAKESRVGNRINRIKGEIARDVGLSKNASWEFNIQVIGQMYFREKEYLSNIEDHQRAKKVFSMEQHMETHNRDDKTNAILGTTLLNPVEDTKVIYNWYNKFNKIAQEKGINLVEAIQGYLTKQEIDVIRFVEGELVRAKWKSLYINNNIKKKGLLHLHNYFPRESSVINNREDSSDIVLMNSLFNSAGITIEGSATKERVLINAQPVRFDNTFNSFMNHVKASNLAFNLTETLELLHGVASELRRGGKGEASKVEIADFITYIVKTLIERRTADRDEGQHTRAEKAFNVFRKKSYNFKLIDPIKLLWDLPSQNIFVGLGKLPNLIRLSKINKLFSNELAHKMRADFGSTVINRAWSRASSIKELTETNITKKKYSTSTPTRWDNFLDLLGKNLISDFFDKLSGDYFVLTDFLLFPLWKERTFKVFKAETGIELTDKNYESIKVKYRKELKFAMGKADFVSAEVYSTSALSEYKIKRQKQTATNVWGILDSYMKSFGFNENAVLWKSIRVLIRKNPPNKKELGAMSKENREKTLLYRKMEKADARSNLLIVSGRAMMYQGLSTMLMDYFFPMFLGSTYSEEEKEEIMEKSWTQALTQYGMLLLIGNKGNLYNAVGSALIATSTTMIYKANSIKKPYDLVYNPSGYGSLSQHVGFLGAHGVVAALLMRSTNVIVDGAMQMIDGKTLTKQDLIDMRAAQHFINLGGLAFGAGINRLTKLYQTWLENNNKRYKSTGSDW